MTTGFFGEPEFQTQNPAKFLAFNLPYVLVPLLPLIRMRKPHRVFGIVTVCLAAALAFATPYAGFLWAGYGW